MILCHTNSQNYLNNIRKLCGVQFLFINPHWLYIFCRSVHKVVAHLAFLFVSSSSTNYPEAFIANRYDICWNSTSALIAKVLLFFLKLVLNQKCINLQKEN